MALVQLTAYGRDDADSDRLGRMAEVWLDIPVEQIADGMATASSVGGVDAAPGRLFVRVGLTPLPAGYSIDDTITTEQWDAYAASLDSSVGS